MIPGIIVHQWIMVMLLLELVLILELLGSSHGFFATKPQVVARNAIRFDYPRLKSRIVMHVHNEDSHNPGHTPQFVQDLPDMWNDVRHNPRMLLKRPESKVLMVATALLLVSTLIRRRLSRWDIIIFGGLTTTLTLINSMKTGFRKWLSKMKMLREGIVKHSTPIRANYFFKNDNLADRVTLMGVAVNVILSGAKFFGGIAFNSAVLVADAGHSLSDLFSDFITLWAVQISRLPPDNDHPYGHGKFESVGSLFLALTLMATGLSVGSWSYSKMLAVLASRGNTAGAAAAAATAVVQVPSWPALLLAALSIGSKEWMYHITNRIGQTLNSQILIANAWHHRSDAFSSVLSLFSIAAAIFLPRCLVADSAAGILIAGMIGMTGIEVLTESVKQLTDSSDQQLQDQIFSLVHRGGVEGVDEVASIRARRVGSGCLVDLTVLTDPKLSTSAASAIAQRARWQVLEAFPQVVDVAVRASSAGTVCPLLSSQLRPVEEVQAKVHARLQKFLAPSSTPSSCSSSSSSCSSSSSPSPTSSTVADASEGHVASQSTGAGTNRSALESVRRVDVHYDASSELSVDVRLCVREDRLGPAGSALTLAEVRALAVEVQREVLLEGGIQHVDVSVDLTPSTPAVVAKAIKQGKT